MNLCRWFAALIAAAVGFWLGNQTFRWSGQPRVHMPPGEASPRVELGLTRLNHGGQHQVVDATNIPLDYFVNHWPQLAASLSSEDQAKFLAIAIERLAFCRPELGVKTIGALLTTQLDACPVPERRPAVWFDTILNAGLKFNESGQREKEFLICVIKAYGRLFPGNCAKWIRESGDNQLRDALAASISERDRIGYQVYLALGSDTDMRKLLESAATFPTSSRAISDVIGDFVNIGNPEQRKLMLSTYFERNASAYPETLYNRIREMANDALRQEAMEIFCQIVGKDRPELTLQVLNENRFNSRTGVEILGSVIGKGFRDPETERSAIDLAKKFCAEDPAVAPDVMKALLRSPVKPSTMTEFAENFNNSEVGSRLNEMLSSRLPEIDPAAAAIWVNGLSRDFEYRDLAIQTLVRTLKGDPETARAWAAEISDPTLRNRVSSEIPSSP